MRVTLPTAFVVWLCVLIAVPYEVRAQKAPSVEEIEARNLFQAGREAYAAARYEAALSYFQQAYDLVPRPALLYNIATSVDRLQQNERALELFRAYLEAEPNAPNRQTVERRIAFLEEHRAVATPAEAAATVADDSEAPIGGPRLQSERLTRKWWFWTVIAAVAVGASVATTVGVLSSDRVEAPLSGDVPATWALTLE